MKDAKQFLVDHYLPTLTQKEKDLWYNTSIWSKDITEIMKSYSVEVINELLDRYIAAKGYMDMDIANKLKREIHSIQDTGTEDKTNRL